MISRVVTVGEKNLAKRKAYVKFIYNVKSEPKRPYSNILITFSNEDFNGIQTPYDNSIMVSVVIAKFEVRNILVNNGSMVGILFYEIFQKMKLPSDRLSLAKNPPYVFIRESVMPK